RLDDQRVTFPPSARVAEVLTSAVVDVRTPVGVDDARVVNHLVADRHHARRLHDAVAAAVDDANERPPDAPRDAAAVVVEIVGEGLEGAVAERAAVAVARPGARRGERLRLDAVRR